MQACEEKNIQSLSSHLWFMYYMPSACFLEKQQLEFAIILLPKWPVINY